MTLTISTLSPFSLPQFTPATLRPETEHPGPSYWLLFQGDKLIVLESGSGVDVPRKHSAEALGLHPTRTQYLGVLTEESGRTVHCYSGELSETEPLPTGFRANGLRSLLGALDEIELALAGRAVQIVNWERTHQFCGRCGTPTEPIKNERAKRCPSCGLSNYPRLSPAIIIAVTRRSVDGAEILLARNHRFPAGRYSVIAGFVEPGESLEECAQREVFEEVGVRIRDIRYFGSQPWPFPNSLMIGFTADFAGGKLILEEDEIADARWFRADNLPQVPPKVSIARRLIDWFVAKNGGNPETVKNW